MFKKSVFVAALVLSLSLTGCGSLGGMMGGNTNNSGTGNLLGGVLGSILGGGSGGGLLGGVLGSVVSSGMGLGFVDNVVGHSKIEKSALVGTWIYAEPGCAFTSENMLAKAGGDAAATQVKQKLNSAFKTLGIKTENTGFAFDQNGNFEAVIKGVPFNGTYTFDSRDGKLDLKSTLGTIPAFVTPTAKGLAITLESKNLVGVLQGLKVSGNNALAAISTLGSNYKGVRLGFDTVKYQQK